MRTRWRAAAFAVWLAAWGALALAAPELPLALSIALAVALFVALGFLPRARCASPDEPQQRNRR